MFSAHQTGSDPSSVRGEDAGGPLSRRRSRDFMRAQRRRSLDGLKVAAEARVVTLHVRQRVVAVSGGAREQIELIREQAQCC